MPDSKVKSIRIGAGGGCAEDWIQPAVDLVREGNLDYICFDSLSESEISAVAYSLVHDAGAPAFDRYLDERLRRILPDAVRNGTKVIGNMGSVNPLAAQQHTLEIARELGLVGLKVAAVYGDNVLELAELQDLTIDRTGQAVAQLGEALISAHAYVPVDPIVEALAAGADVVLAGRVGDGAMYLAPMMYEFGWATDDWDKKALGLIVGHEMECAGQLSGGYFADPPYKEVPDLALIGYPIATVTADGDVEFSQLDRAGGAITVDTCIEQLLYETHDPSHYIHADGIVDFSDIEFVQSGPNRVRIAGTVRGKPAPAQLKVALGIVDGYIGACTVYYGGVGAYRRASLARQVAQRRLEYIGIDPAKLDIRLIGVDALYGPGRISEELADQLWEVGLRVAIRTESAVEAEVASTVGAINMSLNGPASVTTGHGVRDGMVRQAISYDAVFIPREVVTARQTWKLLEA